MNLVVHNETLDVVLEKHKVNCPNLGHTLIFCCVYQ